MNDSSVVCRFERFSDLFRNPQDFWGRDCSTLLKAIPWLKFQNRDGRNIYIRPKGEHALSLVDDLTPEALYRMKASGFQPAIVVETSPGILQAWMNHGRVLSRQVSS